MCVIGRGHVVQSEENAGDDLRDEQIEESRPEDVGPTSTSGDRFVKRLVQQRIDSGTPVSPRPEAGKWSSTIFWHSGPDLGHIPHLLGHRFLVSRELAEVLKADLENAIFNLAFELIHGAERGSGDVHAILGKCATMAGTDEPVFFVDPAHGATQVRAYRRKDL